MIAFEGLWLKAATVFILTSLTSSVAKIEILPATILNERMIAIPFATNWLQFFEIDSNTEGNKIIYLNHQGLTIPASAIKVNKAD